MEKPFLKKLKKWVKKKKRSRALAGTLRFTISLVNGIDFFMRLFED